MVGSIVKTVWKFKLEPEVEIPRGAKVLSVHEQLGDLWIWAIVNPNNRSETRRFAVFATGEDVPNRSLRFIGTVLLNRGRLVQHVFEIVKSKPRVDKKTP